jgi:hypothetical protein
MVMAIVITACRYLLLFVAGLLLCDCASSQDNSTGKIIYDIKVYLN